MNEFELHTNPTRSVAPSKKIAPYFSLSLGKAPPKRCSEMLPETAAFWR